MKGFQTPVFVFNGCLLVAAVGSAAPRLKLPPTLPPHSLAIPSAKPKPKTKTPSGGNKPTQKQKLPPLPATVAKLSAKPAPRPPSAIAATGRSNPDAASAGLADARLRANESAPLFSLEDTIALSLANNPRRTEAQAAVNAARSNIGAVGSQGKLQVDANGTTEYGRNTTTSNGLATAASSGSGSSSGSGGSSSGTSPSGAFQRFDQLTVNASLPITTGGRVKASTRQARYQAVAQIYQLAQVEQDLILSTTLAYLDVLRATQLLRVTNANLSVSQERLRIAQVRYSVGASARLDVLRAQTDLADARSRRIQAVNTLGTNNSNLNVLLGRAPETPIRLASISRLNLPSITYSIQPSSVLPAQQANSTSPDGRNGTDNQMGNTGTPNSPNGPGANNTTGGQNNGSSNTSGRTNGGNTGRANTSNSGNRANTGTASSSTGGASGSVFSGPSAPSGNTSSGAIGPTNSTTPGASGNTTNQAGGTNATGGGGANSTAGATNPTGAANPSGATTTGSGATGTGGATATTGGTTANLGSGSVSAGASTGLQSLAGGTRQSLAVTQAQIGAAEAAVEIAKAGKRPQLGLSLSGLLRNPATFLGNFGASIGLGLAQNLFDSGRTREQVSTARSALDQLKARLAGQRLEVAGAIETSLLSLDSAQRRQNSADVGARSAQEALRVAQIGFRSGVRTTLDLADAQAALLAAQTNAVNSRFDVADSQATLAAAVGIYTVEAQNARERAIRDEQEAAEQARKQIEILQPAPKKKRKKFLGIF